MISTASIPQFALVRYGAVSEVARARYEGVVPLTRGARVVLQTHRGRELATVLDVLKQRQNSADEESHIACEIENVASPEETSQHSRLRARAQQEFAGWNQRIADWKIDLQLVDLEWTLDESKLVLYVLNERGPECTKLAIQAVAAGFGIIEVQPVSSEGPVTLPSSGGGGCGSCGSH